MAFEELIGNKTVKDLLLNSIETNNVLHSYLFVGPDGVGKSLFAKEFAKLILCSSEDKHTCRECKSCIEFLGENHPDFMQINPEDGKTIKIEQIRFLQQKIAEKPVTSTKKVYVINDCDTMTREAANSLLKTLEEPPIYATLILVTANESKLLATIKSRCTKVTFSPVTNEEIKQYLQKEQIEAEITSNMLKQCEGSIGRALKIQSEKESYEQIEKLISDMPNENITQIWRKAEVLYQAKEKILDLLDYMNILLFEKIRTGENLKYIKTIPIVENAKKRILANANYDMTIDNLLLKIWEEVH